MKERYVLWNDIRDAFRGIDHLKTNDEKKTLLMIFFQEWFGDIVMCTSAEESANR